MPKSPRGPRPAPPKGGEQDRLEGHEQGSRERGAQEGHTHALQPHHLPRDPGVGCRVWGLGFGVWGLGCGVWGFGVGVFGVWGLGFRG